MDREARKRIGEQDKTHTVECQEKRKNIIYSAQTQLSFNKYNQIHSW